MTMAAIVNVLTGFFEAIVTLMLVSVYVEKERPISSAMYVLAALALAITTNISNYIFYNAVWNVLILLLAVFGVALFFTKCFKKSALIAVIAATIFLTTELFVAFLLTVLMEATAAEITNVESYRILGTILSKLLAFAVVKVICIRHKINRNWAIKSSYWMLFFLIFTISSMAIYLLYMLLYYSIAPVFYNHLAVWCSLGLLYNMFFSLYLYEKIIKHAETERKQELFKQQIKAQAKHIDEILINQKEIKRLRHDLKNHNIAIKAYLQNQDYTGAMGYLEGMQEKTEYAKAFVETGNVALDAILNTKRSLATSCGIAFETRLQIPEKLFVDPVDLCIIFGNALDNAIEACGRVQDRDKRIVVSLTYAEEALLCKITNTAEKAEKEKFHTVKKDKANHGFGIGNIEAALANYKSVHRFSQTDAEFTFSCKIFNKKE